MPPVHELRRSGPASPTVEAKRFRDGMARLGAAVSIVTTLTPEGPPAGFAATAVCSVTDAPATLLVCVNRSSSAYPAFSHAQTLCVNSLAADQGDLGALFGGRTAMPDRFSQGHWTTLDTDAPVLAGASASFDCRIVSRQPFGTHDVIFCEVLALCLGPRASSLIYFDRQFRALDGA